MAKSWPGNPRHPPPRANFPARLHRKNVSRVMISCPSQVTEISACVCSAWHDLARLGDLTRLKPFTWEKVGSPPRVTLSRQPSDPTPQARFAVSHVNGRGWFISNWRKTWLPPVGLGGGGERVPRVTGPTFLHINRALHNMEVLFSEYFHTTENTSRLWNWTWIFQPFSTTFPCYGGGPIIPVNARLLWKEPNARHFEISRACLETNEE